MIPRIARALAFTGLIAGGMAHAQVSLKLGDLILFDAYGDRPVAHYSRDNGIRTPLTTGVAPGDDSLLLTGNGEIDQAADGNLYVADEPYDHVLKIDPRANVSGSLSVLDPAASTYTYTPENLTLAADGNGLRVGASGTSGAVLKHVFATGAMEVYSSGGILTSDITAAGTTVDGDVIVAQKGATSNLVLIRNSDRTQFLLGTSALIGGSNPVTDIEVLPKNKVAIATGSGGVILASYKFNVLTQKYDTNFQNLGTFGGSAQWVKTDTDGNLLVFVYYTPSDSRILKYDIPSARVDTVLTTTHLTSFAVVKFPVAVEGTASLALSRTASNGVQIDFAGMLQSSTDLGTWQTLDPQPASPYVVTAPKPHEFFRATASDSHPLQGNILFRGNSFTYGEYTTGPTTLPAMVTALAGSLNYTFSTDIYATPAASFLTHYQDPLSLQKVQSNHWHDAVLQNHSTGPTTAPTGDIASHFKYGRELYLQQIAQDPKVNVYLYETPAYRANNTDFYPSIFANPGVFQSQLTLNYRLLAKNLNTEFPNNPPVTLVPTGQLVQAAGGLLPVTNRFWIDMHAVDAIHMSDNRLALTGLAFFVAMTHQNPDGLLSTPTVDALHLNITADKRWLEKLVWRYMTTGAYPVLVVDEPQAQSALAGQLVNFSINVQGSGPITYQWFKDGTAIAGATSSTYSTVGSGGASETYYCVATNSEGSVKSNDAILTSTVEPAGVVALVDFSSPNTQAGGADTTVGAAPNDPTNHWNTWKAPSDGSFSGLPNPLALVRPDGSDGGLSMLSTVSGYGAGANGVTGTSLYASNATIDYWYGTTAVPKIEFQVKGLKLNRTYKLTFFGSRNAINTTADNRQTTYTVIGANGTTKTASIDAFNNTANAASISGLVPDADGKVTVQVTKGSANTNSSGFFYINVMSVSVE